MTSSPTQQTAVDSFFEKEHTYTTQDGYTAPEIVWSFDCRHVTTTPDGHRIAFGFIRQGGGETWTPTGLGHTDWERHSWTGRQS